MGQRRRVGSSSAASASGGRVEQRWRAEGASEKMACVRPGQGTRREGGISKGIQEQDSDRAWVENARRDAERCGRVPYYAGGAARKTSGESQVCKPPGSKDNEWTVSIHARKGMAIGSRTESVRKLALESSCARPPLALFAAPFQRCTATLFECPVEPPTIALRRSVCT